MKTSCSAITVIAGTFTFFPSAPAMANQPPGPNMILAELSIIPLMMLLSWLGGVYLIIGRRPGAGKGGCLRSGARTAGVGLLILLGLASEGFAWVGAWILAIFALWRGRDMIALSLQALRHPKNPINDNQRDVHPRRLLACGIVLVLTTLFMAGMSLAFLGDSGTLTVGTDPVPGLKKFAATEIALARRSRTGKIRFPHLDIEAFRYEGPYGKGMLHYFWVNNVWVEYGPDDSDFTVYSTPARVPFFPYNYMTAKPTCRADQTGNIRMIYVHRVISCPADAPIVASVDEQDIKDALGDAKRTPDRLNRLRAGFPIMHGPSSPRTRS